MSETQHGRPKFGRRSGKFDRWATSYTKHYVGPPGFKPGNDSIEPSIRDEKRVPQYWDVSATERYKTSFDEIGKFVDKSNLNLHPLKSMGRLAHEGSEEWSTTSSAVHGKEGNWGGTVYEGVYAMPVAGIKQVPIFDDDTGFPIKYGKKILKSNTAGELSQMGGLTFHSRPAPAGRRKGGSTSRPGTGQSVAAATSRRPGTGMSGVSGVSRAAPMRAEGGGEEEGEEGCDKGSAPAAPSSRPPPGISILPIPEEGL